MKQEEDPLWYKDAIIYQLHVKTFFDSNGDGIGDFPGLISKLDYLQELGVNTLWLSPLYANPEGEYPGNDGRKYTSYHGYWPIASRALDPRFTSEEEERSLSITTANARSRSWRRPHRKMSRAA